jgi:hypothetical protein
MKRSTSTWAWTLAATAAVSLIAASFWSDAGTPSGSGARRGIEIAANGSGGDLLAAGRDVAVRERVSGDVAVAGRSIRLSAPVGGYVLAAGREVTIGGAVDDDLWAAGERVTLDAPVDDGARLAGRRVLVQPQANIGGDALLAGAQVEVRAPIGGDLRVSAGEVVLASEVGGTVHVRAGNLQLAPGAVIHGDLFAYGPKPPEIAAEARVDGKVTHRPPPDDSAPGALGWLYGWLLGFLALFALGVAVLAASPSWSTRVAEKIRQRVGAALASGVVALLVTPLLVLLLAVTIVGIPLAIVVLALYVALLLLSGVFVALRIGAWGMSRSGRAGALRHAQLAVGACVLALLAALPWIGWIAWVLVPMVGFGALLLERRDAWRHPGAV